MNAIASTSFYITIKINSIAFTSANVLSIWVYIYFFVKSRFSLTHTIEFPFAMDLPQIILIFSSFQVKSTLKTHFYQWGSSVFYPVHHPRPDYYTLSQSSTKCMTERKMPGRAYTKFSVVDGRSFVKIRGKWSYEYFKFTYIRIWCPI